MWKTRQFLTRSIGKFIFRLFRSACCLCCFSLSAIDSAAQAVTNADFFVVGSKYNYNGQYAYDTIPTGCILFWSVKPENSSRASIYRSESGHIAYLQTIAGSDWLIIADSNGQPMPWFVNSGWRRSYTAHYEGGDVTKYVVYPHVIRKHAYDLIPANQVKSSGCHLLYLSSCPYYKSAQSQHYLAIYNHIGFRQQGYHYSIDNPLNSGPVKGVACDFYDGALGRESHVYSLSGHEEMELRWVFRDVNFIISLEAFKMHLSSKWWLKNKYTVGSGGITSINVPGGTGMGGYDETEGSGPSAPSEGGSGVGGSVPGDITNPPITPMGQNGKWVYDPEKKLWNWVGDFADNADQLNPWDNSVMPENQERGLAQEATLRQVKDGVDGLAKESTLQQIRMTLEDFQREQGITPDQLQAMIDNAVVEIVDGQVQYWQGQNLVEEIVGASDNVVHQLYTESAGIKNEINQHKGVSSAISSKVSDLDNSVKAVDTSIGAVDASIGDAKTDIVNAISDISIPENPTVDGQETESYEITAPDLSSQIDSWFASNFPQLDIDRVTVFEDYDIGVFGWKIPFSAFNSSIIQRVINTIHNILEWLVYLSAVLSVFKAMGGGV